VTQFLANDAKSDIEKETVKISQNSEGQKERSNAPNHEAFAATPSQDTCQLYGNTGLNPGGRSPVDFAVFHQPSEVKPAREIAQRNVTAFSMTISQL
jgi:hypothetical protein